MLSSNCTQEKSPNNLFTKKTKVTLKSYDFGGESFACGGCGDDYGAPALASKILDDENDIHVICSLWSNII